MLQILQNSDIYLLIINVTYLSKKYQKHVTNFSAYHWKKKQISLQYFLFDKKCIFVSDTRNHNFTKNANKCFQTEKLILSINIEGDLFTGKNVHYKIYEIKKHSEGKYHKCILKNDSFFLKY